MFKIIAGGMLVLTIIGAAGVAVYDSSKPDPVAAQLAPVIASTPAAEPAQVVDGAAQVQPGSDTGVQAQTQSLASEGGAPWMASGVVASLDASGFEMVVDGTKNSVYVELGPATYWQSQGVALNAAEPVSVTGFAQDGMYHAAAVTKSDGTQILVRDAVSGQPLWSGGAAGGQSAGASTTEVQVTADQWYTVDGVVTGFAQNSLTVETTDGQVLTLQLGRSGFADGQGVAFAVGDQVQVIGYDNIGQFRAGEIDNLTQGGRLMLLDPNGRPLWAGPGTSTGQGQGGQGQGGQGQGGQGQSAQAQGNQGQQGGQGQSGQGQGTQGRGYRGGRTS
jgi:hypothetical protein